jgi:uracil-DNA glycosylase family 4
VRVPGLSRTRSPRSKFAVSSPLRAERPALRKSRFSRRSSPRQSTARIGCSSGYRISPGHSGLLALADQICGCNRCPRLRSYCIEVARTRKRAFSHQEYWGRPVPGFGDSSARFLIVGLAPAAHGGNRTGRVFTGDSSGDWLYDALYRFGWASQPHSSARDDGMRLTDCYVTAAVRCAPPDNRPSPEELRLCRGYLATEYELLQSVRVVLALGRIGWESWLRAAGWWERLPPVLRPGFGHGEEATLPDGTVLVTSYHPSRQNTNTGRLTRPMWLRIFARIRSLIDEPRPRPA